MAHLHAAVVDDHGVEFDLGIELSHLLTALQEQPIPQLPATGNTGKGWGSPKGCRDPQELGSVTPAGAPHPPFPPSLPDGDLSQVKQGVGGVQVWIPEFGMVQE